MTQQMLIYILLLGLRLLRLVNEKQVREEDAHVGAGSTDMADRLMLPHVLLHRLRV